MKSFYFHFNKPSSQRVGRVQVSVHFDGKCHILDNVVCNVPTKGKIKKTQPRWVMVGKCNSFEIINGIGYLN